MNTAWAIDGKTGKQIWRYQRQLPAEGLKVCCGMVNRGFAVYGDRLFMLTLDAHLMAFEAKTGKVVWDVELAKYQEGYAATGAPLLVKDKLIVGVAGGEYAIRGFLDAYDVKTGTRVWRFNTIPAPGEPGSETWPVESWERGGAPTWVSGSYDPELNTLYWGTGNPNPDFWSASRLGDNLYATSMIALDADTGKLRWHYQFTPHDTHDWDSNQVPVIANLTIAGQPRKVVMTANRNGFFYVLDRTNGKVILAKPYVNTTWAKEVGADGRPIEMADQKPTPAGTLTCPDLFGGTNFQSPAFNPCARPVLRERARDLHDLYRAGPARELQGRRSHHGRQHASAAGRIRRAARDRSDDRRTEVGAASDDPAVVRRAVDCRRSRVQRRRGRLCVRGGRADRQGSVALSDRFADLRAADDLHDRQPAVRDHAVRLDLDGVCAAGLDTMNEPRRGTDPRERRAWMMGSESEW